MDHLPFDMGIMEFLADHRLAGLTAFFTFFTDLGEVQGYLAIIIFLYVVVDKRLAVRLALLVALTMGLNHLLKIAIKNPRPFIEQGNYLQKWAVPLDTARELATEYSTPSGHAMAAGSFYTFLFGAVRSRIVRILAVLAILLIGASRPYLGVHYVEDILLGWAVGLACGFAALCYADRIGATWGSLSYSRQIATAASASLALWLATIAINGWQIDGQPRAFLGYAGIVIAQPLELRLVDFDPRSASWTVKVLRYLLSAGLALLTLIILGDVIGTVAGRFSIAGYLLQYLRYVLVAIVSIFGAPCLFIRIGLAARSQREPQIRIAAGIME
jgi:membrane-associated phospholipid phosphatase